MSGFIKKIADIQKSNKSLLCIGLDPDPDRLPAHLNGRSLTDTILAFNTAIISATCRAACAYKLNLAFYESLGSAGWRILERTMLRIPPGIVTIADGKRGDIGNSARMYAHSTFEALGFDACTVHPYMGRDSVEPFLRYSDKAAFILARTSNPGSADIQLMKTDGKPLFEQIAGYAASWNKEFPGTAGLVMGATHPESLSAVSAYLDHTTPLLIPGIGAQGGSIHDLFASLGQNNAPVIINSSRQILYASSGHDFEQAASDAADTLKNELNASRASVVIK